MPQICARMAAKRMGGSDGGIGIDQGEVPVERKGANKVGILGVERSE